MHSPHDPIAEMVVNRFLVAYMDDAAADRVRPVEDYAAEHPGFEDLIRAEFTKLQGACKEATTDVPGGSATTGTTAKGASARPRIGPYDIERELGRGGQAVVYLARDTRLGRLVALKALPAQDMDEDAERRFRREAEAASRLDHPGICPVFDVGEEDGVLYIAFRYVEGESLASRVGRLRRRDAQSEFVTAGGAGATGLGDDTSEAHDRAAVMAVVGVFERAARALHAAHEAGIIHRDIKPHNIMLDRTGEPVILDFGIARDLGATDVRLTQSGVALGSPAYMSPEQVRSEPIDHRTDIYSLAVTMFECLTLSLPFRGSTREALFRNILVAPTPDPRRDCPAVPRDLKTVLEVALDKDAHRRYVTALAFAEDLARVRRLEPIRARPAGLALRTRRWAQRNPATAVLLSATILALAAGLIWSAQINARLDEEKGAAQAARGRADRALADLARLADGRTLRRLRARADELWPAVPAKVAAMRRWLDEASELVGRLPVHRARLQHLRAQAHRTDRGDEDAASRAELGDLRAERARIEAALEIAVERRADAIEEELEQIDRRIEELEEDLGGPHRWTFDGKQHEWEHELLTELVEALDRFGAELPPSIRARIARAEAIGRSMADGEALWRATAESIAGSPLYPELGGTWIPAQVGLVPLGADPDSGLEEFLHLATHEGPIPRRDGAGRLGLADSAGIVLVLLPGGTFTMGSQGHDPHAVNHDPRALQLGNERPVHEVALAPFFMAKHEMTQGQWAGFTGENPSSQKIGETYAGKAPVTPRHPVESFTWRTAEDTLRRLDLELPTEAQWEYACRAGTTTPWYTGTEPSSLKGHANLADEGTAHYYPRDFRAEPGFDDGFGVHAPVGTFRANAFGLHDVHGNVWEWCRDRFAYYDVAPRKGDGLRGLTGDAIFRGGGFAYPAHAARAAFRQWNGPSFQGNSLGLRASRPLRR